MKYQYQVKFDLEDEISNKPSSLFALDSINPVIIENCEIEIIPGNQVIIKSNSEDEIQRLIERLTLVISRANQFNFSVRLREVGRTENKGGVKTGSISLPVRVSIKANYTNSDLISMLKIEIKVPDKFFTLFLQCISLKAQKKYNEAFFLFFTLLEGAAKNIWVNKLKNNANKLKKLKLILNDVDKGFSFTLFTDLLIETKFTDQRNAIAHANYLFLSEIINITKNDVDKLFSDGYNVLNQISHDLI